MEDINEMIADAKAEEQAKREQEMARRNEKFRKDLKNKLAEVVGKAPKVEIDLEEYTLLKMKEMDLNRLTDAITDDLELNYYSKDDLRLGGERTLNTFRALYSDTYEVILEALKTDSNEGE